MQDHIPPSDAAPNAAPSQPIHAHRLAFSGDGGVYFGVWIVNVLLTIITLGIYTPWARRRTIRYFYGHTDVAGTPLEFTAGIRSMVVGFLLFAVLYIAMEVAGNTGHDLVVGAIVIAAALLSPWLWGSAMRFRLGHTRWRGLRLRFAPKWREVYLASWPVFAIAAVWLAAGFALSQMVDAARAQEQAQRVAEVQLEAGEAGEADATEVADAEEAEEETPLSDEELAEIEAAVAAAMAATAQDAQAGTEEDEEADAQEADADADGWNPDEDDADDSEESEPLPRPTWAMGGVVLAALVLTLLCFIRLEFNYKRLLVVRTRIGGQAGQWKPVFADFVRVWLATLGVFLLSVVSITVVTTGVVVLAGVAGTMGALFSESGRGFGFFLLIIVAMIVGAFAIFLAGSPALAFREARMFQLMWNNIGVGQVARFRSELRAGAFVWLRIKNILLGLITFGLYRPFARVAEYGMKAASVTLHVKGDLEGLVGRLEAQEKDGFGDAVADALGLDLIG